MTHFLRKIQRKIEANRKQNELNEFQKNGYLPWTAGYETYKWNTITETITSDEILKLFNLKQTLPSQFGWRIDERIVEYPWLLSQLNEGNKRVLDAGSALNFLPTLQYLQKLNRDVTIMTLAPEDKAFWNKSISYHYGDLRLLPFRDEWFDEIVSISTIEHVGFDNTIYGASKEYSEEGYLQVVNELWRVLAPEGTLYITVPYGQADDIIIDGQIFARQFNATMMSQLLQNLNTSNIDVVYYRYTSEGWILSNQTECDPMHYYNIHQQRDYDEDIAAAARAVCCIKAVKTS